jgi:hypothetical protein
MQAGKMSPCKNMLITAVAATLVISALSACKKTVISDKVTPLVTPSPAKGIGDGVPDSEAIIRLTGTKCDGERVTTFEIKVAGLRDTGWTKFTCDDKTKEIKIATKSGFCNVLQLRAHVVFTKAGLNPEDYYRETSKSQDKPFFIVDQSTASNDPSKNVNIHFEDTNDDFWAKTYTPCLGENKNLMDKVFDVIEGNEKTCAQVLGKDKDSPPAVDWNDFEFSVESDNVQFSVESFPDIGCNPN